MKQLLTDHLFYAIIADEVKNMYKIHSIPTPTLVYYGKTRRPTGWQHNKVIKEHHCLFLNLDGECVFEIDEKEQKVIELQVREIRRSIYL